MICLECAGRLREFRPDYYKCLGCGMTYEQLKIFGEVEGKLVKSKAAGEKPARKRTPSQSAKLARERGMEGQREFRKAIHGGAEVVPGSGAAGGRFSNDTHLNSIDWQAEVKRFRDDEKTLYGWIMDERERPDFVAMRADRKPWVVAMRLERFNALLAIHEAAQALQGLTAEGLPIPGMYDEYIEASRRLNAALEASTRKAMAEALGVNLDSLEGGENSGKETNENI